MRLDEVEFDISPEVLKLGLTGAYFVLGDLLNRQTDARFEEIRTAALGDLLSGLSPERIENDRLLNGFRELHNAVGRSGKKNVASPESLLRALLRTGDLPRINLLVDIYNLVSVRTRLALGAHDLQRVAGNIHLRLTTGTEHFWPVGYDKPKPVRPGEYAYIDDDNDIICRLEVRQVEKTKISEGTTECFYIVQGNAGTDAGYIRQACDELLALTKRFCGGQERILFAPWL